MTFTSRAKYREAAGPWGLELIGSGGAFKIQMEMIPRIYEFHPGTWNSEGKTDQWRLWHHDPTLDWPQSERTVAVANRRVVDDWFAAIRQNRDHVCSGYAGMRALEMAFAVFWAALKKERVEFPLKWREHPFEAKDRAAKPDGLHQETGGGP